MFSPSGNLTHCLISTQVVLDEDSLATSLTITNTDPKMMAPQCLLHTYLAVEDARQVMIFGLEESVYEDKLAGTGGDDLIPEDMPAIAFRGETDRIYRGVSRKTCPIAVRPEGVRVDAHGVLLARELIGAVGSGAQLLIELLLLRAQPVKLALLCRRQPEQRELLRLPLLRLPLRQRLQHAGRSYKPAQRRADGARAERGGGRVRAAESRA